MRLVNIDPIVAKFDNCECYSECEDYDSGVDDGIRYVLNAIEESPIIDPVHAAGGCYCKECHYYEPLRDYPDCSKKLPYGYCYYWKYKEGESPNEVDENDFCSKGVISNA